MSESSTPLPRFAVQDHNHGHSHGHSHEREHAPEKDPFAPAVSDTEAAWQNIARAAWTQGERPGSALPDISKQSLNEMLGLNFNPNSRTALPYTNLTNLGKPDASRSSIDWNALARGETVVINPIGSVSSLPNRPLTPQDMRRMGNNDRHHHGHIEIPRLGGPDVRNNSGARLLDPVRDPAILSRVPDALYIGQQGKVTSTRNKAGETQDYWLSGSAARAFAKANEILAPKGKQIIVEDKNGAGRTVDTQTEIYNRSRGGRNFKAGAPTSSNHTRGNAMDVANYTDPDVKRALLSAGWRQGDSRGPIANDLHHFSFPGAGQQEAPRRNNRRR